MDDAYQGTIDYNGESLDEARAEIAGYFADGAVLGCSAVALAAGQIVAASLVSEQDGVPFVAYVMTAAVYKNRGIATHLVGRSLTALAGRHREVRAWITDGNHPSEAIFSKAGFRRIDDRAATPDRAAR